MFSSRRLVQCREELESCPDSSDKLDMGLPRAGFEYGNGVLCSGCNLLRLPLRVRARRGPTQMGSKSGFRRERNGPYSSPSLFRTRRCTVPGRDRNITRACSHRTIV